MPKTKHWYATERVEDVFNPGSIITVVSRWKVEAERDKFVRLKPSTRQAATSADPVVRNAKDIQDCRMAPRIWHWDHDRPPAGDLYTVPVSRINPLG